MFPSINSVRKLRVERAEEVLQSSNAAGSAAPPNDSIATILKAFGSSIDDQPRIPMRESDSDWPALMDRIRSTAVRIRAAETDAREKEQQFESILERARADFLMAEERVRAAEVRTQQIESAAAAQIRAAEERADAAEERARIAEAWLRRIHETISSEFAVGGEAQL